MDLFTLKRIREISEMYDNQIGQLMDRPDSESGIVKAAVNSALEHNQRLLESVEQALKEKR